MTFNISPRSADILSHNCHQLASLRDPKESLWVFRNKIYKVMSPEVLFADRIGLVYRVLRAIAAFALKIIFFIGWKLTFQSEEKVCACIERSISILESCVGDRLEGSSSPVIKLSQSYPLHSPKKTKSQKHEKLFGSMGALPWSYDEETIRKNIQRFSEIEQKIDTIKNGVLVLHQSKEASQERVNELFEKIESLQKGMSREIKFRVGKDQQDCVEKVRELLFAYYALQEDSSPSENLNDALTESFLKETWFPIGVVRVQLEEVYGVQSCEKAFDVYRLSERSLLSGLDFYALVIAIVTNLTNEDLEEVYQQQRERNDVFFPFEYTKEFDDLFEEEKIAFLEKIRSITSVSEEKETKVSYLKQFRYFSNLLNVYSRVEVFNPSILEQSHLRVRNLHNFCFSEYLSRELVYALYNGSDFYYHEGVLFSVYDIGGRKKLCSAEEIIGAPGLYGFFTTPLYPEEKEPLQVMSVFRGTYCKTSVRRDLSLWDTGIPFLHAPGHRSFQRYKRSMIEKYEKKLEPLLARGDDIKFMNMGHSLGGSDAAQFTVALMEYLREKEAPQEFFEKCSMHLYAFTAPGVDFSISDSFVELMEQNPIDTFLHYFDNEFDLAREVGPRRLGYGDYDRLENFFTFQEDKPPSLKISVYNFQRPYPEGMRTYQKLVRAHTEMFLNCENTNNTYIENIFTNNHYEDEMPVGEHLERYSVSDYTGRFVSRQLLPWGGRVRFQVADFAETSLENISNIANRTFSSFRRHALSVVGQNS